MISSDYPCAHTARNKPFAGADEVTGLESDDSNGSCIVLVGGTGRTSERMARGRIPIVKIHHVTRASVISAFHKEKISTSNLNHDLHPQTRSSSPTTLGSVNLSCHLPLRRRISHQLMSAVGRNHSEPRILWLISRTTRQIHEWGTCSISRR